MWRFFFFSVYSLVTRLNGSIVSSSRVFLTNKFIFLLCFVIPLPVFLYSFSGNNCLCNRAESLGQVFMSLFIKCWFVGRFKCIVHCSTVVLFFSYCWHIKCKHYVSKILQLIVTSMPLFFLYMNLWLYAFLCEGTKSKSGRLRCLSGQHIFWTQLWHLKVKCKVLPRTVHEGPDGEQIIALLFLQPRR